ncbi:hypothetical protein C8R47DRAFT_1064352 [Mycena vitilis]|nr:hypothetical protein C8R47DRAFT_1064352 [Mycena vitilis]
MSFWKLAEFNTTRPGASGASRISFATVLTADQNVSYSISSAVRSDYVDLGQCCVHFLIIKIANELGLFRLTNNTFVNGGLEHLNLIASYEDTRELNIVHTVLKNNNTSLRPRATSIVACSAQATIQDRIGAHRKCPSAKARGGTVHGVSAHALGRGPPALEKTLRLLRVRLERSREAPLLAYFPPQTSAPPLHKKRTKQAASKEHHPERQRNCCLHSGLTATSRRNLARRRTASRAMG